MTPGTTACHIPLSTGFPRQEYWSGLPFPSPGALPNPEVKPESPALASGFFTNEPARKPGDIYIYIFIAASQYTSLTLQTMVSVWQKPTQHCKAIIFQLKINLKKIIKFLNWSANTVLRVFHLYSQETLVCSFIFFIFLFFRYLFIWLFQVLIAACRIF